MAMIKDRFYLKIFQILEHIGSFNPVDKETGV